MGVESGEWRVGSGERRVVFFCCGGYNIWVGCAFKEEKGKGMKTILIVLAIAVGALALMMGGLGMKMLLHKEKEFKRPCANADPKTGRCAHCTCGRKNEK